MGYIHTRENGLIQFYNLKRKHGTRQSMFTCTSLREHSTVHRHPALQMTHMMGKINASHLEIILLINRCYEESNSDLRIT